MATLMAFSSPCYASSLGDWLHWCEQLFFDPVPQKKIYRPEVFQVLGGMIRYDIQKAHQLIDAGHLRPSLTKMEVGAYAVQSLGLSRQRPWSQSRYFQTAAGTQHVIQMPIDLNLPYAKKLSPEKLTRPGLLIQFANGDLIIDGNHRLAQIYLEGGGAMDFYVLSRQEAEVFMLPPEIPSDI